MPAIAVIEQKHADGPSRRYRRRCLDAQRVGWAMIMAEHPLGAPNRIIISLLLGEVGLS